MQCCLVTGGDVAAVGCILFHEVFDMLRLLLEPVAFKVLPGVLGFLVAQMDRCEDLPFVLHGMFPMGFRFCGYPFLTVAVTFTALLYVFSLPFVDRGIE